jgi:hypothetical protein
METKNRLCPHCKKEIDVKASRCPHCRGKVWTKQKMIMALILAVVIFLLFSEILSNKNSPIVTEPSNVNPINIEPSTQEITLTESQCQELKNEFYSFIFQKPFNKTQLGKELLEQYVSDAGISVKRSNPNVRYILPKSECGQYLGTSLDAIVLGEKNNGGL